MNLTASDNAPQTLKWTDNMKQTAYAKINLFLKICGKYDNGYHKLFMLMQQIGIGDEIEIVFDPDRDFDIDIESEVGIAKEKDLGYRAARAFYDRLQSKGTDKKNIPYTLIKEVKHTPSQAGLGGGSSDAASVLKMLQEYFGDPLTEEELIETAAGLGADVPFFIKGGTCFCEGVGEIVTELPGLKGVPVLLVKPEGGVSTPECYALSDKNEITYTDDYKAKMTRIFTDESKRPSERIKEAGEDLINDLQDPAIKILPVIEDVTDAVNETGSVFTAMTGSGSCVFGIFEDEISRDKAERSLKKDPRTKDSLIISTVMT